ncbi:dual specificity protein phosphatase family protein [Alienimonas chondri]|uniref:Dual specificity phosphatase catalytic domain-containing protein n=1 Tax=Alienimonas chondri TaxID=2681879 RepID=A0ABX1V867_9PLAN|nr:dual specificity protein phosphatase [Alienimonas chondri]NNJ24357.1 hypothetical protein [Alienimonas chondri]
MIRPAFNGSVYLGNAGSARDLRRLYDLEIAAVVDLAAEERPAQLGRDLVYVRVPLHDDGSNPESLLVFAVESVSLLLRTGRRTLIACSAGMSRSPVIAAAAIALHTGDAFGDCLVRLTKDGPCDVSPSLATSVTGILKAMCAG